MRKTRNSKPDSFPGLVSTVSGSNETKKQLIPTRSLSKLHYKQKSQNLNPNTASKPLRSSLFTGDTILSYSQMRPSFKSRERLNIKKTLKSKFNSYDFIGYIPDFEHYDHLLRKNTAVEYYFPRKVLRIMDYLNHQPAKIREIYRVMNLNSHKTTRNISKGGLTYSVRPKEKERYMDVLAGSPMLRKAVRWQNMKFLFDRKSVQMDIIVGKFPAIKDFLNGDYLINYDRLVKILTLIGLSKDSHLITSLFNIFNTAESSSDAFNIASMVVEIELCRKSSYLSKIKGMLI